MSGLHQAWHQGALPDAVASLPKGAVVLSRKAAQVPLTFGQTWLFDAEDPYCGAAFHVDSEAPQTGRL